VIKTVFFSRFIPFSFRIFLFLIGITHSHWYYASPPGQDTWVKPNNGVETLTAISAGESSKRSYLKASALKSARLMGGCTKPEARSGARVIVRMTSCRWACATLTPALATHRPGADVSDVNGVSNGAEKNFFFALKRMGKSIAV
jgi:hypothetical protein